MRNGNYDPALLDALNELDLPAAPLTGAEFNTAYAAARRRVHAKSPRKAKRLALKRFAMSAAAACVVLLGGMNFASPALAESLPVVGGLFSWINRGRDVQLYSEQLDNYAASVDQTAEAADSPYTMTLAQVYNDGEWLRISLELTADDNSLAGYDLLRTSDEPLQDPAAGYYGTLQLDDGTYLENEGNVTFTRQDDQHFVLGLNYPLFLEHDKSGQDYAGRSVSLTLDDLVACNQTSVNTSTNALGDITGGQVAYTNETPLDGSWTFDFTIPAVSTEGVRSYTGSDTQNGVTLYEVRATPAATRLKVQVPCFTDPEASTYIRLLDADGNTLKLERSEGVPVDETDNSDYLETGYYDAVLESSGSVTVEVYQYTDWNDTDSWQLLTSFTVPLA